MTEKEPILCFNAVSSAVDPHYDLHLREMSFLLSSGEMGLFRVHRRQPRSPVADAAQGLLELQSGQVLFQQKDWRHRGPSDASRSRGRIGRFFGAGGWVHHLDVDENVTLRERHHTRISLREIETEASDLANKFGLKNGVPKERPARVDGHDLQRSAAVRMFLGKPALIILDEPVAGLHPDVLEAMIVEFKTACAGGAAVLWLSADPYVWANPAIEAAVRIDLTDPSSMGIPGSSVSE